MEGALVALQDGVDLAPELIPFGDANQERRVVVYDPASIDNGGQLGEGLQAVAAARLSYVLAELLSGAFFLQRISQIAFCLF